MVHESCVWSGVYSNQKVIERLGYKTEPLYVCGVMFCCCVSIAALMLLR